MKKRTYRTQSVQAIAIDELLAAQGERIVVGCDAAKAIWRAAFMTDERQVLAIMSFDVLETPSVLELFVKLREGGKSLEVVAESTGTYADAFAHQVTQAGFAMFQISAKHVKDANEGYDGVPTNHDSKAACVIADQHIYRRHRARRWSSEPARRALDARSTAVDVLQQELRRDLGRVEGLLARHWPELTRELKLTGATLPQLLVTLGSPQSVRNDPERARELLQETSRGLLAPDKIERILAGAKATIGVPMCDEEQALLRWYAERIVQHRRELREKKKVLTQVVDGIAHARELVRCFGPLTTAILLADVGDPRDFNARRLLKHLGLNLKEDSSGTSKRKGLHITKRGSSRARHWLYLAALRLIKTDPIVAAWVNAKAVRQGDAPPMKMKAVIALMRKLVTAIPHLARGSRFDANKLFDVERLKRRKALPVDFCPSTPNAA